MSWVQEPDRSYCSECEYFGFSWKYVIAPDLSLDYELLESKSV